LLDLDDSDGKLYIYRNNVILDTILTNDAFTNYNMKTVSDTWTIACGNNATWTLTANYGQDSSFAGALTAQGNQDDNEIGDFYYDVPTGYLALCTSNLAAPEIADPTAHFNTVLYQGLGAAGSITGVGFQPDFTWIKLRTGSAASHFLADALRGNGTTERYGLASDTTGAQSTGETDQLKTLDADGFTFNGASGQVNNSSYNYVAWNWKGDGVSGGTLNEVGTIDSQVNVNTTSGFSIVSYTGDGGSSATIGHSLSQAPELVMVKNIDAAENWAVGSSKGMDFTDYIILNTSAAVVDDVGIWNDATPSATVFTVGTSNLVNNTDDYIAYCFHSVEGYSRIGSYTANADADGVFIYLGFRPSYVMIKDITTLEHWMIMDSKRLGYNVENEYLTANSNSQEGSTTMLDLVSNGIKIRTSDQAVNRSGDDYLYIAFAESPFKTVNAR